MDTTPIGKAIQVARALIGSHGLMNHMRDYDRKKFAREGEEELVAVTTSTRYEFSLDPNVSIWSPDNFACGIIIAYEPGTDYDHEGDINRRYRRRVAISFGSCEISLQALSIRENFIKAVAMLVEMIESALPDDIVLVVQTAAEIADRKALREEQIIAENIYQEIGWKALKGLRKGGKPRLVRLTDSYVEKYGAMPSSGAYRYEQIRRMNRRGVVREKANYLFKVFTTFDGTVSMKVFRTT